MSDVSEAVIPVASCRHSGNAATVGGAMAISGAWLQTLGIPRDARKFAQLDLHRMQSSTSDVIVFVGAAQSRVDDVVQLNIQICDLDSRHNPAVHQYALVGSIATLDTALTEGTTIVSMCQKDGFAFQSVHTTDRPR